MIYYERFNAYFIAKSYDARTYIRPTCYDNFLTNVSESNFYLYSVQLGMVETFVYSSDDEYNLTGNSACFWFEITE